MTFEFLRIEPFIATELGARALTIAFRIGIIDRLADSDEESVNSLAAATGLPPVGLALELGLLGGAGITRRNGERVRLTAAFREALAFRDLLEAKLGFLEFALPDIHRHFEALLRGPGDFMGRSRVFDLFRYDRCLEVTPENLAATARWVGYTTALTRYEAEGALAVHDFAGHVRLLDVGGNSGEFARQICRRHGALSATVLDLPVVCELGRRNLAGAPEAARIAFAAADMRRDPLPPGHDVVTFKSVLHDWPRDEAAGLIRKAADALTPGGTLLVYERGPIDPEAPMPYAMVANLPFLHFLRTPDLYTQTLARMGFEEIRVTPVELDMPFFAVSARKPA